MIKSSISYIALEQLDSSLKYTEATEAYTFVHRIFDVFGRMINNLKTHLLSLNGKQFKRSELRFYHESKTLAISHFIKLKHFPKDLMVPIPSGMKVPYLEAVTILDELIQKINIQSVLNELITYLSDIPLTNPVPVKDNISHITKQELETKLRIIFSSEKTLDVPLHTVVSNFNEILVLDKKILGYEDIFQSVETVCEKLDKIEKLIDNIVTDLELHKKEIDHDFAKALYQLIGTAAKSVDFFGVVIAEIQRIEHNFTILLNKLVIDAQRY